MAVPTSPIQICNLAMDRLGQDEITSIDSPDTKQEDVCARWYDVTRREVLRRFIFNFSRKYIVLTKSTTKTPAFGYANAYLFPNDVIRLMALGNVAINADTPANLYTLSEGFIFADFNTSATGLQMEYIFDAKDVNKYDPLFLKVLWLQLAANMAYKFTLKPSIRKDIMQELQDSAIAAAAVAGQEKPPRRLQRSRLRDVRRRGGFSRDNTRV